MVEYRSFSDLSRDIFSGANVLSDLKIDLVVGIPRSGMIPAYMISLLLNVGCIDLQGFLRDESFGTGITRRTKRSIGKPSDSETILLVDDSVSTGKSMEQAVSLVNARYQGRLFTLAAYGTKQSCDSVDFCLSRISIPRVFQWNIFHHSILSETCLDIDGVLCRDPTTQENDDGERYATFLEHAEPLFIPTYPVRALVTNRLEKYRLQTTAWLKRHNVNYKDLIMLDAADKEGRKGRHVKHKSEAYSRIDSSLFIESSASQARGIADSSLKPVFCIENFQMIYPSVSGSIKNGKPVRSACLVAGRTCKRLLPIRVKQFLKSVLSSQ